MSRNTKIVLAVVAGLLLLSLCACGLLVAGLLMFRTNVSATSQAPQVVVQREEAVQEQAVRVGQEIADYEVPAGYHPDYEVHALGFTLVAYAADEGRGHIMLLQAPGNMKELDAEALARQMEQMAHEGRQDRITRLRPVGEMVVTIRGEEVTLYVSEGTNGSGDAYRQVMGAFQGRGGAALLLIAAPVEDWDQEVVDAFVGSIR